MAERWFRIKGEAAGDRTLEEQMAGLAPALAEAWGRAVLDLGCAEGLIGREFARAGALSVHGIEVLHRHVAVAERICAGLPMRFTCADLGALAAHEMPLESPRRYDIVLALAVLHKMADPSLGVRFCCWSAKSLVVIRLPAHGPTTRGILLSKHDPKGRCNLPATMQEQGFRLDRTTPGPRKETVQYWRRLN